MDSCFVCGFQKERIMCIRYTYAYLFSIFRRKHGGVRRCVAHVFVYTINDAHAGSNTTHCIALCIFVCWHTSAFIHHSDTNVVVSFILLPHRQCLLRDEYIISWYCSWFTNSNQVLFGLMYSS